MMHNLKKHLLRCALILMASLSCTVTHGRETTADQTAGTWPPAYLSKSPAEYQERQRAALQQMADRLPKLSEKEPSVLWARCAIGGYLLGQHEDLINTWMESDKFQFNVHERVGFHLFAPSFVRFYGIFNDRTGFVPGKLPAAVQAKLERQLWEAAKKHSRIKDASRTDWQIRGTENQHLAGMSSNFLVARFLKDHPDYSCRVYDDRSTLQQQYKAWNAYWHIWFDEHAKYGLFKEDSSGYLKYDLQAIINVRDFAEDRILQKKAHMFLDLIFANFAEENLRYQRGGPKSRVKGEDAFVFTPYHFIFNPTGDSSNGGSTFPTSSYYPAPVIVSLATERGTRGSYSFRKQAPGRFKEETRESTDSLAGFRKFDINNFMIRHGFVSANYAIGSHEFDTTWRAYNQLNQRWQGIVFDNHPQARIEMDGKNFDTNYITNPFKTIQDRNVMVTTRWATFIRKKSDPNLWVHFTAYLDSVEEEDGWIFVRSGDAYAGIKVVGGSYSWKRPWKSFGKTGNKDRASIGLDGDFPIITVVNEAVDYANDFNAFKRALKAQPVGWKAGSSKRAIMHDGLESQVQILWGNGVLKFATITHEGVKKPGKVNGKTVNLHPPLVNDSPFIRSKRGSGVYYIRKGDETMILDFSDPKKPKRSIGVPPTSAFPPGVGQEKPIIFSG